MISRAEIRFALRGLVDILRFNPGFVQFYDRSQAGALRSFSLAIPLLAIYLLDLYIGHDPLQPAIHLRMLASLVIAYVINWVYFPLFLFWITRLINREARVIGCIAIYNWLSILTVFTDLPLSLLSWAGMNDGLLQVLGFIALVIYLVCEGYVLAISLQISGFFAAAFVILDLVLHQILFEIASHMGIAPLF